MFAKIFVTLLAFSYFTVIFSYPDVETGNSNGSFYYFAYGSNLLAKRIHIKNPSAVFYSPAKLANHRLDFNVYDPLWNGAVGTIVEDEEKEVWGSLWTIDINQMKYLDEQEDLNWYRVKNVTVTKPDGTEVLARTYQEIDNPSKTENGKDLPLDRRPSSTYLEVIALGAIESHLPAEYVGFIFAFPTNGKLASTQIRNQLGYPCPSEETTEPNGYFYYFGYGSNLLAKRIHINNPSAVLISAAKLPNYRLDFINLGDTKETWNGAAATIVEDDETEVWGSLWRIDIDQMNNLDQQEYPYYFAKNVTVTKRDGTEVLARTYIGKTAPNKLKKGEDLPSERRPSNTYLEVLALGAIESHLPAQYIGFIFSFPTNGQMAAIGKRNQLGYPF
ncbi:unnamed protein product [Arctia plantaginis]|uniref:gamma-glutamylcyclotransferase n=1 Tax=Arctia plantaginis TaxID=874455 RepID=A0A8S1B1Y5_ARCPL|nr:unnamed protein product [Arctia plantaginis]CAB3256430.1 unnamed protein product [Arctia plantaginis]